MKFKRLTAMLIAVAMTVGMMPALVFAEETTESEPSETTVAQTTESKEPKETKEKKPAETTVGDQRDKQQPNESTSDSKQGKPVESEPSSDPEPEATKETTAPETSGENDKRDDSEKTTESEPATSTKPAEEEPTAPETKEDEDKGSDSDETAESEPDPTTEPAPESSKQPDESDNTTRRNSSLNEITSVAVIVNEPVAGAILNEPIIPSGANIHYYAAYLCWNDKTTGGNTVDEAFLLQGSHFHSHFKAGHQYEVVVSLWSEDDYIFSNGISVTVNGQVIEGVVFPDGRSLDISYTFPALAGAGKLASVSVKNILEPEVGCKPSFAHIRGMIPDEGCYLFHNLSNPNDHMKDGIRWYDVTTKSYIDPNNPERFQIGHQYMVEVCLKPDVGAEFTDDTKATLNGHTAQTFFLPELKVLFVSYTFPPLTYEIAHVSFNLVEPKPSLKPDYDPELPDGAPYYSSKYNTGNWRNDVLWEDTTTDTEVDPDSGVFEAGHEYKVWVNMTADEGYYFSKKTTATINGADVKTYYQNGQLLIECTFRKLERIDSVSVDKLDTPVAGEHPDYWASIPADSMCFFDQSSGTYTRNGIIWYDVTTKTYVDPDSGVFEAGHQYEVEVDLKAYSHYFFNPSIVATLNGKTAETHWVYQDYFQFKFTFPVVESNVGDTEKAGNYNYSITKSAAGGTGCVTLTGVDTEEAAVSIPATVEINGYNYAVTRIGPKAFYGNKTIKTLFIGPKVTIIDSSAFSGCSNLFKVSGGKAVQTIGSYAFANCPKLSSFTIASYSLKKIGSYAFNKDKKLKTLYIRNTSKLTKSGVKKSLKGSSVKTVKVKKSKVKKYKKYFKKSNSGRKVKVKK